MTRRLKQILYGGGYIAILFAIIISIYNNQLKPVPSCIDGVQNQEETSVDCGGPNCTACDLLQLKSLETRGSVRAFHTSNEKTVLLGEIANPNANHGTKEFEYRFLIYDMFGALIETVRGISSIGPNGRHFLFAPIVMTPFSNISRVELSLPRVQSLAWFRAGETLAPHSLMATITTSTTANNIFRITGSLENRGSIGATNVTLIAILFDEMGNEIFASQTIVPTLVGRSEVPFVISFPSDTTLIEQAVLDATKLFVTAQ